MGSRVKLCAEVPPLPIELSSHLVTPGPFRPADLESELGFVSHLKNSSSNASRGARGPGALSKNCHLLPSTAIFEPQNRYTSCNRSIPSVPLECLPASLGLCPKSIGVGTCDRIDQTLD